jgi:iron complex transport system permease protein
MYKAHKKNLGICLFLFVLFLALIISVGIGAVEISPGQVLAILLKKIGLNLNIKFDEQQSNVLIALRLPRVVMALLVGATLSISGASMQGLFRNPLADATLLGISSGASFGVGLFVILQLHFLDIYTLPLGAFLGSLLSIAIIFFISQKNRSIDRTSILLAGIAINALCFSGTGLFSYLSNDEQMRTITFWQLGALGGSSWTSVLAFLPFCILNIFGLQKMAMAYNTLSLGDSDAKSLGIKVEKVKWITIVLVALGVGTSVALCGGIGFVGLVVPHLIRLLFGSDHRYLLVLSTLAGSVLLILSDLISRILVNPLELPIGIVTSILGAPFFLYLVLKNKNQTGIM